MIAEIITLLCLATLALSVSSLLLLAEKLEYIKMQKRSLEDAD